MSQTLRRSSGFLFTVFFLIASQGVFAVKPSSSKGGASRSQTSARKNITKEYLRTIHSTFQTERWSVTFEEPLARQGNNIGVHFNVITRIKRTTGVEETRQYSITIPNASKNHWNDSCFFVNGSLVNFMLRDNSAPGRNRRQNSSFLYNLYNRLDFLAATQTVRRSNAQAYATPTEMDGYLSGVIYGMPMLEPNQIPRFSGSRIIIPGDGTAQYIGTDQNSNHIVLTMSHTGPNGSLELRAIETPDSMFELTSTTEDDFEYVSLTDVADEGNNLLPGNNETASDESPCRCSCFKFGFGSSSRM